MLEDKEKRGGAGVPRSVAGGDNSLNRGEFLSMIEVLKRLPSMREKLS